MKHFIKFLFVTWILSTQTMWPTDPNSPRFAREPSTMNGAELGPFDTEQECRDAFAALPTPAAPGQLQHAICKSSDGAIVVLFPAQG